MEEQNLKSVGEGGAEPLVSVCVMTYNHVGFIGRCLDSILEQKTDFVFEICLGEDESSDGTRELCEEYAAAHPDCIRLLLHSREDVVFVNGNPTAQGNFSNTMKQARGEYMILCDGDDYWSDPLKLQKQVDYLEANRDMVGCFHRIAKVSQHGEVLCPDCGPPPKNLPRYSQAMFLEFGGFAPLFSVLFRNHYRDGLPPWFMEIEYVDLPLHILNTSWGDYGFIDEVMGCYRIHQGGMSNGARRAKVVSMALDSYMVMGRNIVFADEKAYSKGVRALKLSLMLENVMDRLLPRSFKGKFDQSVGIKVRRKLRKWLVH